MCSAVRRRTLSNGMTASVLLAAEGCGAGAARAGAPGARGATGAPASRARATASTSLRVMRPPSPVPVIVAASRPYSAMSRRTNGDVSEPPDGSGAAGGCCAGAGAGAGAGAACGCATAGAGCRGASGAGSGSGSGGAAAGAGSSVRSAGCSTGAGAAVDVAPAPSPSPSPMTASFVPTSTVSPSGTRISVMTPADIAGTSESTLSVDTSNNGSSTATDSPTCLNHFVIVPSVTVSPSCGIVTSAMEAPSGECHHRLAEELAHRRVRLDEVADLFDRGFPVDGEVALAELLGDPRSHHVHAEDATAGTGGGILLGDDLHEAFGLADDHGSAVAGEAVLRGDHVEPGFLGGLLGVTGERHLGMAVDAPG